MRDVLIAISAFVAGISSTLALGALFARDLPGPRSHALRLEARRNRERMRRRLRVVRGGGLTEERPAC